MTPTHDPQASQARFLDAAEEVFAAHGYEGARVDAIADAAHVNKRMLYHYFGDKAGLYAAVVDRLARRVLDKMERAFAEAELQEPAAALVNLIEVYFDIIHDEPHYAKIFVREGADDWRALSSAEQERRSTVMLETMGTLFQRVFPLLQRGVDQGVLRDDLDLGMVVVLGTLLCRSYMLALSRLDALYPRPLAEAEGLAWAKRHIVTLLLEGLRARTPPRDDVPLPSGDSKRDNTTSADAAGAGPQRNPA